MAVVLFLHPSLLNETEKIFLSVMERNSSLFKILPAHPRVLGREALRHVWGSTRTSRAAASSQAASLLGTCGRKLPKYCSQSSHELIVETTGLLTDVAAGRAELWFNSSKHKSDLAVPTVACARALVYISKCKTWGCRHIPLQLRIITCWSCASWALAQGL